MVRQESILLFGEGKTDAVFLAHLRSIPELFPLALIEERRDGISALRDLLDFIRV